MAQRRPLKPISPTYNANGFATATPEGFREFEPTDTIHPENIPVATQAEAEAGTASDKFMTPLRTAQAIAAASPGTSPKTGASSWVMLPQAYVESASDYVAGLAASNEVQIFTVRIPEKSQFSKIGFRTYGSGTIRFALFSLDGNTKLLDSGAITTTGAVHSETIPSTVTINAGVYLYAFTADSNGVLVFAQGIGDTYGALNAGRTRIGLAANPSTGSGGSLALPATLGAITKTVILRIPIVTLED